MNNRIILGAFALLITMPALAGKYETAMGNELQKLFAAHDEQACVEVGAAFERIGNAEENQWLPWYYAAFSYIRAGHNVADGASLDHYLDQAQNMVDRAGKLLPENDEIITLQGYIYMMKVTVDPASRGQQYSGMAMQAFSKARQINAGNPRALLLMGRMKMGTDQYFGNDISSSCEMINQAAAMFDQPQPADALAPAWGKQMAEMFLKDCQQQ